MYYIYIVLLFYIISLYNNITIAISTTTIYDESLFLIGDSLDRIAVKEWCIRKGGFGSSFGEGTLKHDSFNTGIIYYYYICINHIHNFINIIVMGSYLCKYNKLTASFVHVFGSSSHGPYLYMDENSIPLLGTSDRITKSLEYLIKEINIPTRIIL